MLWPFLILSTFIISGAIALHSSSVIKLPVPHVPVVFCSIERRHIHGYLAPHFCPEEYFSGRPYDGPHLLFYTKESIKKISEKYDFDVFRIDTSMYSFSEDYRNQKRSQDRYHKIRSGSLFNIKQFVKKFIPKSILKLREKLVDIKNIDEMQILGSYTSNSGDNTYLRGILKKK